MLNVLIISTQYSEADHIRNILHAHRERFSICGMASNSVAGMTLIESVMPDIVIMPAIMTFWNASDLINTLLVRGRCPAFVLLHDSADLSYGPLIDAQIADILPAAALTDPRLMAAMARAEGLSVQSQTPQADPQQNRIVQRSLDLSNLVTGMLPPSAARAQTEYGQLQVGNSDCWVILATPTSRDTPRNLFEQIDRLSELLERLHGMLKDYGAAEVCVYHESNLCILLAEEARISTWGELTDRISQVLTAQGLSAFTYQISDAPCRADQWSETCRDLLDLTEKRFFYSPPYLQPQMLAQYKIFVTQDELFSHLSEVMLAVQNLNRPQLLSALTELERLVSHSLSHAVYSTAFTQLAVIFNRLLHQFSLEAHERSLSLLVPGDLDLSGTFAHLTKRFLELFNLIKSNTGSHDQLISSLRIYIEQHLGEKISLADLADHVHMNQSYLSRLFKEETKISLSEYIAQKRVDRAKQLLQGPYKVITIAEMTGFNDARYFSQVFRRYTGKTPQQYRKELV